MIDQQIVWHFVQYSECLYHHLLFYATQIIKPFFTSRISVNYDKGLVANRESLILINVPLV